MSPEDLLELEQKVIEGAVGRWKRDVDGLREAVLVIIARSDGKLGAEDINSILFLLTSLAVPGSIDETSLQGVLDAHEFGVGLYQYGVYKPGDVPAELPDIKVSKNSEKAVTGLTEEGTAAILTAIQQLQDAGVDLSQTAILNAIAPVLQSPAKMERAITWAINNSANSAVSKLALKTNETMVWIPERDGCVACTAYAGVRSTKTGFPTGLTYGKKPIEPKGGTLPHPPLHPHCRCTVEVGISDEFADALKREGIRSILRDFSLPSESEAIRIDAAKRLLDKDPVAPESVKKYSRRKIKNFEAKRSEKKTTK